MKQFLRIILGGICISSFLAGCTDNSAIEELKTQLEELKSSQIASINTQISNIRKSIEDLEGVDRDLNTLLSNLQKGLEEQGEDLDGLEGRINELVSEDQALSARITELKTYCEQQDNGVKSWAEVTFATLEQHSAVLTEISTIKNSLSTLSQAIADLDSSLTGKIADAESSIKGWVNEQLTGYYTIAQTEAKLKTLKDGYVAGDQALAGEIETLRQNLDQAKANLTTAYQTAISAAITENNGTINQKIAADIKTASDALQEQINELAGRLDAVENRISALEANLAKIINMVQSVVVIPDYPDGSIKMTNGAENEIRFEIYPLTAASSLAALGTSALSLDCVETGTKASIFTNIPIPSVAFDGEVFTIIADGSGLSDAITSGLTSANARLRISDGTTTRSSDYFRLALNGVPSGDGSSVTVGTEKLSAISVVLKGKANIGNTAYSDLKIGFQYSLSPGILPSNSITVEAEDADADYNYTTGITGLEPSTTYYFRSIIRQNGVDTYGSTMSFSTRDVASLLETLDASGITHQSATLNAKLDLMDVLFTNIDYGFYWGLSEEELNTKLGGGQIDSQVFSVALTNLPSITQYWYKAYVRFDNQVFYGGVKNFTTDEPKYILDLSCEANYSLMMGSMNGFLGVTVNPVGAPLVDLGEVHCNPEGIISCSLTNTGINITPLALGNTILTVSSKENTEINASCAVTVTKDPVLPASVTITKTDSHFSGGILNLAAGESLQLEAKVKNVNDELTTDYPVVWSVTEGEDVISITEGGKVTAKSGASGDSGKVKVEVQGYPIADVLTVKVLQAPTGMGGFTFTGNYSQNGNGEVIMKKGKTCPFMFSFTPSTAIQVPDVIVSDESILSASVSGKTITLTGVKSSTSPVTVTVRSHYNSSVSKTLTVYVFDYDKFDVKPGDYVYWNGSQFLSKDCGLRQVAATSVYVDASGNRKSSPTFTGTTQSGGYNYIGVIASTSIPNEEDFMGCGYLSQCRDQAKASELYASSVRNFRKSNLMGLSNSPSTHALVIRKDQSTDKMHWQDNIEEIASSEDQQSGTNIYQYQLFGILAFSQEQAAELNPRFPKYNYTYCLSGVVAHLLQLFYSNHLNNSSYAVRPVTYINSNYTDVPKLYGATSSRTTTGWFLPGDLEWSGIQWNLPLIKASLDNGYSTALSGEYWSTCEAQYGRTTVFQFTVSGSPIIARTDVYKERDNYKSYARAVLYL